MRVFARKRQGANGGKLGLCASLAALAVAVLLLALAGCKNSSGGDAPASPAPIRNPVPPAPQHPDLIIEDIPEVPELDGTDAIALTGPLVFDLESDMPFYSLYGNGVAEKWGEPLLFWHSEFDIKTNSLKIVIGDVVFNAKYDTENQWYSLWQ